MSTKKVDFESNEFRFRFLWRRCPISNFYVFHFSLRRKKWIITAQLKNRLNYMQHSQMHRAIFFFTLSLSCSFHARTHTHAHTLFLSLSLSLVCVRYFFFQHSNTPTRTHQCINTHHWTFNWLHSITISRSVPFPSFSQPVLCLCLSSLSPFLTH